MPSGSRSRPIGRLPRDRDTADLGRQHDVAEDVRDGEVEAVGDEVDVLLGVVGEHGEGVVARRRATGKLNVAVSVTVASSSVGRVTVPSAARCAASLVTHVIVDPLRPAAAARDVGDDRRRAEVERVGIRRECRVDSRGVTDSG